MSGPPTLEQVRTWVDVSDFELPDELLAEILAAETALQATDCAIPEEYPPELGLALYRRCARAVAAKGLPLGSLPLPDTGQGGQYGALTLPRLDAEIERYEHDHRHIAVA